MTGPDRHDGGSELDQPHAPGAPATPEIGRPVPAPIAPISTPEAPASGPAASATTGRPAWWLFLGIATAVIVLDQLTKAWVFSSIVPGSSVTVIGDLLRFIHSKNDGALFGLFGSSAPVLAVASIVVIGLIVWYHARSGRNLLISVALGLLLGGALGNLLDRVRHGYVIDWVDMGLGTLRFWTFNIGDSAITVAILLLLLTAIFPSLGADRSVAGDPVAAADPTDGSPPSDG